MENPITAAEQASDKLSTAIDAAVKNADELVAKIDIKLKVEDKLAFTELENSFLKIQVEMQDAQKTLEQMQKNAQGMIEQFAKTYAIDPLTHTFDGVNKIWKAL
jgi:predicted P-loop ATPase